VIVSGLDEGEEIVTQGAFNVDAAAQLEGKPSMMDPNEKTVNVNHTDGDMSGMKM
jgi:Cu(I)/Ag(I) efflux system membrane fusion protein